MAKYVSPLTCLVFVLAASIARAQTPSLEPVEHPNHYIVVIDASGSTTINEAKRALYERVLTEDLLNRLFTAGFGKWIPPYDVQRDKLSLFHFGIVTGDRVTALSRLKQHDFRNDFIHPIYVRRERVDAQRARAVVIPTQTYLYTILSWAKPLALRKFDSSNSQESLNRTFLIVVNDGLPNENSTKNEIRIVSQWSRPNYDQVAPIVDQIERDYRLTNGEGKEAPAWSQTITDNDPRSEPFFIEAFEVLSTSQMEWETRAASLQPLNDFRLEWSDTSGNSPSGILKASLSENYQAWVSDTSVSEQFLSTAHNSELRSAGDLILPVTFNEELTCAAKTFEASFNSSLSRVDPLLGKRTVNYKYTQTITAPLPMTCTVWFASLLVLSILAVAAAVLGIAYFIRNRFFRTQIDLEPPGMLAPIRIARRGQRSAMALVLPQEGLEPFGLILPSRLKQWLFYNGATISIATDQPQLASVSWSNEKDLPQIRLPFGKGYLRAHWKDLPATSCAIKVQFTHGTHHSEVALTYPPALANRRSDTMTAKDIKVWVALDLGSESMAAYYETADNKSGMIEMQRLSKTIMDATETAALQLELLVEKAGTGEKISPRLWNRVSFKDRAQPVEPNSDHATLCFAKDPTLYGESLFSFFHRKGGWPPVSNVIMPNPKILFQHQVGDIFDSMRVVAKNGAGTDLQYVRLSPEMLIKDLTTQVIINFVLESPELRRFEKKNIHLTITVPNVYSLPHAETIKRFVHESVPDLAEVEVLSESDAVAYYALNTINHQVDSPALIQFKENWKKQFGISKKLCLVTIDVGKGTTDLSCVLVKQPPPEPSLFGKLLGRTGSKQQSDLHRQHSVQGKTGRSSGGNYLNYIFAKYFDARLESVGRKFPLISQDDGLPFRFLKRADEFREDQTETLAELEKLIEQLKIAMNQNCEIDEQLFSPAAQRAKLESIAKKIISTVPTEPDPERERHFRSELVAAMFLPNRLDPVRVSLLKAWFNRIKRFFGRATPANSSVATDAGFGSAETAELKGSIQGYVKENVDDLLDSLQSLVRAHQAITDDRQRIDSSTFLVLSGQASQFKPLRKAIKDKCDDLGIPSEHVLTDLDAVALKEACCRGAVNFWQGQMLATNASELHGTYGCIDRLEGTFKAFNMKKVNTEGVDTVSFPTISTYYVIYTPRSAEEVQDREPQLYDGATALIARRIGSSFTLRYDASTLSLKIDDQDLMIGSFGSVDSSIYEKVWPEILKQI